MRFCSVSILFMLSAGKELVWSLLRGPWCQLIPLSFPIFCEQIKSCFALESKVYLKSFFNLCKNCSKTHYKHDYWFGLMCTLSKQLPERSVDRAAVPRSGFPVASVIVTFYNWNDKFTLSYNGPFPETNIWCLNLLFPFIDKKPFYLKYDGN
jgi:hypothetical protein